ncbi:MAG: hypothetical protein D6754_02165 [Alphaproteobacteria bacterium]|nr:MAG: hypothetical protein D6754_02165 [Alphaproteobacteria bacterium]
MSAIGLLSGCSWLGLESAPEPAAPAVVAETVTATGQFVGESGRIARGSAEVVLRDGQWIVRLSEDFFLDGGEEPQVVLGKDGVKEEAVLGPLTSYIGRQEYLLTEGLDIGNYLQVYVWSAKDRVPLARADLNLL